MTFQIDCPCGRRHQVTAAQAGCEVPCLCGRGLIVPSLGQLNQGARTPAKIRGGESISTKIEPAPLRPKPAAAGEGNPAIDVGDQQPETVSHIAPPAAHRYAIVGRDLSALRLAVFAAFTPVLVLLVLPIWLITGVSTGQWFYGVALTAVGLIGLPSVLGYLAARRIGRIGGILSEGPRVSGEIVDVWYSLPWPLSKTPQGYLEYNFIHNDRSYVSSTNVYKTAATSGFKVGDRVTVAVDQERPQDAFVVELYLR